jgi:hypothetical protein
VNVSGINKGKLMCETRKEFKQTRSTYQETNQVTTPPVQQNKQQVKKKHEPVDPAWSLVKKNSELKKDVTKKGLRVKKE